MKTTINVDGVWLRIVISDLQAWNGDTFFSGLDEATERITEAVQNDRTRKILFDCSPLQHIDTSTISVVVQTMRVCGNRMMVLYAPHSAVRDLVELLGIGRIIKVVASEAELEQLALQ